MNTSWATSTIHSPAHPEDVRQRIVPSAICLTGFLLLQLHNKHVRQRGSVRRQAQKRIPFDGNRENALSDIFGADYCPEYSSRSRVCRLVIGTSCPSMKTCFTSVFMSSGSPLATTTFAVLPTSSDPSLSATPQISAALNVIAFSASS